MPKETEIEPLLHAGLECLNGIYTGPAHNLLGDRWEYIGILSPNKGISPGGETVDLDRITSAVLNDDSNLAVIFSDGRSLFIPPDRFTDDMRNRIRDFEYRVTATYAMPQSDSELKDLFPLLYPTYSSKMYYDELRERERIDLSLIDPTTYKPGTFVDYTDQIEYLFYDSLERRLRALGCKGRFPNIDVRRRVISTKFYEQRRNPFREWLETLVWDGEPRVDTWFKKVFNATAPPLEQYGLQDLYLLKVSRAWFCGAVARAYRPIVHEIVPVLIGGQGLGKTTGLRYSAGKDVWFTDTTVDAASANGPKEFLDAVRGMIVVEMSEGSQLRTREQDKLKAFISKKEDQYRKPYSRRDEIFPRHFILAASSNLDNVFTDLTGNRRYYPIYCHAASLSDRKEYDREQVWAEAKVMYEKGEQTFISASWFPAMVMQEYATVDNANVSTIESYLDNPNNDDGMYTRIGATITKEEAMFKIFGKAHVLTGSPEDHAWKSWISGTKCWEKTEHPVKVPYSLVPQRAYTRVRSPMQNPYLYGDITKDGNAELLRKCLDEANLSIPPGGNGAAVPAIEKRFRGKSPADIYRAICKEQGITKVFTHIDIEEFMPETQRLLLDNGYLYYDRAKHEYRTVVPLDE